MPNIYQKSYFDGYSKWINTQKWSFFPTFTTAYPMSPKSARRLMDRTHLAYKNYAGQCTLFWTTEPNELRDGWHIHGLLLLPGSLMNKKGYLYKHHFNNLVDIYTKMAGSKLVTNNNGKLIYDKRHRVDLRKFDSRKNAGAYALKYIMKANKGEADYDLLL